MLYNDYESIKSTRAMFMCGIKAGKEKESMKLYHMKNYFKTGVREILTLLALIILTVYLFTIDNEG